MDDCQLSRLKRFPACINRSLATKRSPHFYVVQCDRCCITPNEQKWNPKSYSFTDEQSITRIKLSIPTTRSRVEFVARGAAYLEQRETTELVMEESCGMLASPSAAAAASARRWARRVMKVRMGLSRTHASTNPMPVATPLSGTAPFACLLGLEASRPCLFLRWQPGSDALHGTVPARSCPCSPAVIDPGRA
jgi:hypothetical protein